ncbi:MAG: hypothetical protein ACK4YP_27655, partial [Myxococcota bacterium]
MAERVGHDDFTSLFASAAAWCDASGRIVACNAAFAEWAQGPVLGARVHIQGQRGALLGADERPRPLVAVALA